MNLAISTPSIRRGISLIEGVLYLVIALAVIIGGIVFFQQAQMQSKIVDTARAINLMSEVALKAEKGNPSHESLPDGEDTFAMTGFLAKSNLVPTTVVSEGGDGLVTPWGGEIAVWSMAAPSTGPWPTFGSSSMIAIALRDIPIEACMQLFSKTDGGQTMLGNYNGVYIYNWPDSVETDYHEMKQRGSFASAAGAQDLTPTQIDNACKYGNGVMLQKSV